jgi:hypothetical protein
MAAQIGTRVRLRDQGEGWFSEYHGLDLVGTVRRRIAGADDLNPWYLVELDDTLELQERGAATFTGLGVFRYRHLLIRSRWVGQDVERGESVSVFVNLVPADVPLPQAEEDVARSKPRIWATCSVEGEAA